MSLIWILIPYLVSSFPQQIPLIGLRLHVLNLLPLRIWSTTSMPITAQSAVYGYLATISSYTFIHATKIFISTTSSFCRFSRLRCRGRVSRKDGSFRTCQLTPKRFPVHPSAWSSQVVVPAKIELGAIRPLLSSSHLRELLRTTAAATANYLRHSSIRCQPCTDASTT